MASTESRTFAQNRSSVSEPGKQAPDAHDRNRGDWFLVGIDRHQSTRGQRQQRSQLVAEKRLVERRVDDALIGIEPRDQLTACVEKLDIGHGARVARLADLGQDAHSVGRKFPAELTIAAHGGRQRVRSEPIAAPEHHELEGTVDGQRVGQPGTPQRPLDPLRRRRRGRDPSRDRALSKALDSLDPLHGGTVKQDGLIDFIACQWISQEDTIEQLAASRSHGDRPGRRRLGRESPRGRWAACPTARPAP